MKPRMQSGAGQWAAGHGPARAAAPWVCALFLMCAGNATAQDQPLGRLFFTPAERAGMDLERLTGVAGAGGEAGLKLNGIATNRSSGKHTLWLNGSPWRGAEAKAGIAPTPGKAAQATVTTAAGEPVPLSVGDRLDRATGTRFQSLPPGSIVVNKAR